MEQVIGIIEDIVFRNEDNGFSVVELREESTNLEVTAVGNFPFINPGERENFQLQ